ncbi:MAG: PhzF family phenazine biosynthesis protein [Ignavibacteriales bacterium]|nr:PhzF family phenazine biosynthesis protein [Ignavibacteriales bacterium]
MSQKIFQVDSFTNIPFKGNPAGVCILNLPREEQWMQDVAREMNLSETAFLVKQNDGYNLRWFTPTMEVELCGHATLASAHILWEEEHLQLSEKAIFHTQSGLLTAMKNGVWIELDFPALENEELLSFPELASALRTKAIYIGKSVFDYIVEVESEEVVRNLKPDFVSLGKIPGRGAIVTATSDTNEYDFVSRYFAPQYGIDEDPVTGSAHCCLAVYWKNKLHKTEMIGYQASSRGGIVKVNVDGNRVKLSGQTVTVMKGVLL